MGTAATALLAGSVAFAQTPPPPREPGHDMRAQRFERMCKEMPAMRAGRLAYLEVKLGITDQQRPAWNTYVQEIKAAGEPLKKPCDNPPKLDGQADAAAILGEREKVMTAMLDSLKLERAATEKLQPSLTAEQKTTLANATRRMMHRGPGFRGHEAGMRHRDPAAAPGPGAPAAPAPR